jgi:hypothetical protein
MHCPSFYKRVSQGDEEQWYFLNAPPNFEIAEEIEISDVRLYTGSGPVKLVSITGAHCS